MITMVGAYKRFKRLYRNLPIEIKAAFWFVFCNVLQRGIQFIVTPIYTRLLTTHDYGVYSMFLTWINFFAVFATLNLSGGVYYNGLIKDGNEVGKYTLSLQTLTSITTLGSFIVLTGLFSSVKEVIGIPYVYMPIVFLVLLFQPAQFFWMAEKRIDFGYKQMILIVFVLSSVSPIVGIILVLVFKNGAFGLACGYAVSNSVVGIVLYFRNIIRGKQLDISYWKSTLWFSVPLIPHYLSQILLGQSDRVMISYYNGKTDAGIYTLAYQIAMVLYIITSGINDAYTPWMYKQMKEKKYEKIDHVGSSLLVMYAVLALPFVVMAPEIVAILGTSEYYDAVYVIPPVIVSSISNVAYSMYGGILFFFAKTKYVAIASFAGAVTNVLLNILLLPKYGFVIAGITTVISSVLMMILNHIFMNKVCKTGGLINVIYKLSRAIMIIIGLSVMSALCVLFYPYLWVRIIIVGVWFILILVRKKEIISIISRIRN